MLPGYEVLDHKSDIELKLHAPSWRELLLEAGRALSTRLWAGMLATGAGPGSWHTVELKAPDRAALLVRWLNELLYEAEAGWWVPVEFILEEASPEHLRARVRCVSVDDPPPALKAATPYGVQITPGPAGGLEATVILDV
jgi:SHS2 domain-containing protein